MIEMIDIPKKKLDKFDEMACASGFSDRQGALLFLIDMVIAGRVSEFWLEAPPMPELNWGAQ